MKVLVTGSSGWLGRHLVPMLERAGHEPVGLDVAPSPFTDALASVTDREAVDALFDRHRFDGVLHAAALHKPDIARYPQRAFVDVNVAGTLTLLEAASARPGTRFVLTSTTSLMISRAIREERAARAAWLDEDSAPLEPRNIYGVTKLAAEHLCRQHHVERGLSVIVLRTSRFFPEEDDTDRNLTGPNLKANELLHRRASVRDMARAHLAALESAREFGLYVVSAPTPFSRRDAGRLARDAAGAVTALYPDAPRLYADAGWHLPRTLGRVYDGSRIARELGFAYETGFRDVLEALRQGREPPVDHDAAYVSPASETGWYGQGRFRAGAAPARER